MHVTKSSLCITLCAVSFCVPWSYGDTPTTRPVKFEVFDNLRIPNKPDLAADGLLPCNLFRSKFIWSGGDESPDFGKLPAEADFKKTVKDRCGLPGPIVIDIETVRLSGKPEMVERHFELFITLIKWTHEALPGHVVGYYGHGLFPEEPGKEYAEQTARLAAAVDAYFPSMYTSDRDRQAWKSKAAELLKSAHKLSPGKPVYFYIWPQYHRGSKPPVKALDLLPGDQWAFELRTAREIVADGVVLWSGGSSPAWDNAAPWWVATEEFMKRK